MKPVDEAPVWSIVCFLVDERERGQGVDRDDPPLLCSRPAGFSTLVHIVLERQESVASARAVFDRLWAAARSPRGQLSLDRGAQGVYLFCRYGIFVDTQLEEESCGFECRSGVTVSR
jgi:hypothetical protein